MTLKERIDRLEDELKSEKNKVMEHEKERRASEATLFEATHQLKEALRAANKGEELKRLLDTVQKRFLLLGEVSPLRILFARLYFYHIKQLFIVHQFTQAQARIQEKMGAPVHMARQEVAQIQRCWSEEVSSKSSFLIFQLTYLKIDGWINGFSLKIRVDSWTRKRYIWNR